MIRIHNLKLDLDQSPALLRQKLSKLLGTRDFTYTIERESLDARRRGGRHELQFNYTVAVSLKAPGQEEKLSRRVKGEYFTEEPWGVSPGRLRLPAGERVIVAGFGPAGLFAAYLLAAEGYRPVVLERGDAVEERRKKVEAFWAGEAALDPESNVQFGEGGAGTFSDGKLTSRSKDPWTRRVREILVEHGAPPDILYSFQPHIGTDLLENVVRGMRENIIRLGGEVHFRTPVTGLSFDREGRIEGVMTPSGSFRGPLFLGVGHSARDTFRMLCEAGLRAEPKDFAVGFRIEHEQAWLNRRQYGAYAAHPRLGAASYQVHSGFADGRNAYSFCMCPGGHVIAAASETDRQVVNGMSYHAREGLLANSAILTSVKAGRDFGTDLFDGMVFQQKAEAEAFRLGGGGYHAPAMRFGAFAAAAGLEAKASPYGPSPMEPSYRPGIKETSFETLYTPAILAALARGILDIGEKMQGFADPHIWLTGVETRSSSPLRFVRDSVTREAEGHPGVYPIGEGAGYAGGIVSAALDGLRSAACFISLYAPPSI